MSWDSIVGQQRVKGMLRRMIESGRLPHALLFHGPAGSGKDAMAIELARVLNCERGGDAACGECPSCEMMDSLRHPNLRLVFPLPARDDESSPLDKFTPEEMEEVNAQIDEKAANPYHRILIPKASGIKVSSIREIRRDASFRAQGKGRLVVIISEAERMNPNAANALLKTLEEPGGDMLLVLTTSQRDALLPTIRSRCQLIRFDPLRPEDIRVALMRRHGIEEGIAEAAARMASGSFGDALDMALAGQVVTREEVLEYIRAVVRNNPMQLHGIIQQAIGKDDRQAAIRFLVAVGSWFRDVLLLHEGLAEGLMNEDLRDALTRFAEHYPHVHCGKALEEIDNAIEMIQKNLHLVNLMIVLSQRLRRCIVTHQ